MRFWHQQQQQQQQQQQPTAQDLSSQLMKEHHCSIM
jgi:hypothetical protein